MQITIIDVEGLANKVQVQPGSTLMEVAMENDISGIDAECGGGCSCGTCHVHVAEQWSGLLAEAGEIESSILEFLSSKAESSRLSCQIELTEAMEGLTVSVAPHD